MAKTFMHDFTLITNAQKMIDYTDTNMNHQFWAKQNSEDPNYFFALYLKKSIVTKEQYAFEDFAL